MALLTAARLQLAMPNSSCTLDAPSFSSAVFVESGDKPSRDKILFPFSALCGAEGAPWLNVLCCYNVRCFWTMCDLQYSHTLGAVEICLG